MSDERFDLEISRVMKAPRAKVWRAFADPAHLARWWCPQPWVTEVKAFEFRAGGAFHTYMTGPLPDGTQGTSDNPGCFLEIVPLERIVSTSMLLGGWRPATPWLGLTSIFTFSDVDGGTLLHARAMHATPESRAKHKEMGFEQGWGIMLAQWGEFAAGLPG
jgi:uncharacterized protein YndB with AHSA1/START domain